MYNPLSWLLPVLAVMFIVGLVVIFAVRTFDKDGKPKVSHMPAADRVLAAIAQVIDAQGYFDPTRLAAQLGWGVGAVLEQLDELEKIRFVDWQRYHPPNQPRPSQWDPHPPVCRRYWLTPEGEREAKWCEVEAVEQLGRTPCLQ